MEHSDLCLHFFFQIYLSELQKLGNTKKTICIHVFETICSHKQRKALEKKLKRKTKRQESAQLRDQQLHIGRQQIDLRGYKTFFMLNTTERENDPAQHEIFFIT